MLLIRIQSDKDFLAGSPHSPDPEPITIHTDLQ